MWGLRLAFLLNESSLRNLNWFCNHFLYSDIKREYEWFYSQIVHIQTVDCLPRHSSLSEYFSGFLNVQATESVRHTLFNVIIAGQPSCLDFASGCGAINYVWLRSEGFSLRGRPAYSLLVLFLGTFYDLTKQKKLFQICAKLGPAI